MTVSTFTASEGFISAGLELPVVISSNDDKSHVCTNETSDKWLFDHYGLVSAELEMRHARRQNSLLPEFFSSPVEHTQMSEESECASKERRKREEGRNKEVQGTD